MTTPVDVKRCKACEGTGSEPSGIVAYSFCGGTGEADPTPVDAAPPKDPDEIDTVLAIIVERGRLPGLRDAAKRAQAAVASLRARAEEAEAEAERLRVYEPRLKSLEMGEGRVEGTVKITPEFRENFAVTLASVLADSKAENYVEMKVVNPADGAVLAVCVQRCNRKTPHEFRKEAESSLERMRERVQGAADHLGRLYELKQRNVSTIREAYAHAQEIVLSALRSLDPSPSTPETKYDHR